MTLKRLHIDTPYGTMVVAAQTDLHLYVQAGRGSGTLSEPDTPDLDLGNAKVYVNGHINRDPDTGEWTVDKRYTTINRTDSARDATTQMCEKVYAAMLDVAQAFPADALEEAGWANRDEKAANRDETAAKLRDLSLRLRREAQALRFGGREEYHDHRLSSGAVTPGVRHVRTADGELLPSLPEVKVYSTDPYGPRLP